MLDLTQALPGKRIEVRRSEARSVSLGVARGTLALYVTTLFVSSGLLFLVQPMFAKMVLPMLGGTPAVWNTCMVFFQAMLLAGYLYAHASTRWLGVRRQACLQIGLLLLPLIVLPIGIDQNWVPRPGVNPIPWLLALLMVAVGLPFFVVSTSAPLLQKWFATTGHPSAGDPYFLYTASNCGSVIALVAYPALMEPALKLADQSWVWALGYATLAVLTMGCAVTVWRSPLAVMGPPDRLRQGYGGPPKLYAKAEGGHYRGSESGSKDGWRGEPAPAIARAGAAQDLTEPLTVRRRLLWVALAFVPSSLLLGVTTYLSTDIAAVPLLWTVPLILYSLSFVLAFSARPLRLNAWLVRALPFIALPTLVLAVQKINDPSWLLIPLHLLMFFAAAVSCHRRLATDRPSTEHLTEFYLWLSVGGVLGGLFNALVAPVVFTWVIEYPLAMVLACMLRPPTGRPRRDDSLWWDFALPLALAALGGAILLGSRLLGANVAVPVVVLLFGLPAMLSFGFADRPLRLGLGVGIILFVSAASPTRFEVLHTERSFFGVHRVSVDRAQTHHLLFHGSTLHGQQSLDPARSQEPLSYFHRSGPIGQLFAALEARSAPANVAVLGLGSGSLAAYGRPDQRWTFYEIDPTVERIARAPAYFTFLRDSRAEVRVVLGDGRLSLRDAPTRHYGLIILDAFSSDSLPVHLITREAVRLYLSKLADEGVLAFNISNRYLRLRPVLAALAHDAGLVAFAQADLQIAETEARDGKTASEWLIMARHVGDLKGLTIDPRWTDAAGDARGRVWTDDFSNILSVFMWR